MKLQVFFYFFFFLFFNELPCLSISIELSFQDIEASLAEPYEASFFFPSIGLNSAQSPMMRRASVVQSNFGIWSFFSYYTKIGQWTYYCGPWIIFLQPTSPYYCVQCRHQFLQLSSQTLLLFGFPFHTTLQQFSGPSSVGHGHFFYSPRHYNYCVQCHRFPQLSTQTCFLLFFYFFWRQKADKPTPCFCQVERRFHSRESNRQPLP